jgi:Tfp pilus assembly protein PilO
MDGDATTTRAAGKSGKIASIALRVLHNPFQLRVVVMLVIFAAWYLGFCMPMSSSIDRTVASTSTERKRLALALEVERLRAQVMRFDDRLPRKTDPNEWVHYMLEGVRRFPLRMVLLDSDGMKDVGPYKAVVVKLEVEGAFHDVDAFLRWVEGNSRLLRVDGIRMEPSRAAKGKMSVQMVILGVMG